MSMNMCNKRNEKTMTEAELAYRRSDIVAGMPFPRRGKMLTDE